MQQTSNGISLKIALKTRIIKLRKIKTIFWTITSDFLFVLVMYTQLTIKIIINRQVVIIISIKFKIVDASGAWNSGVDDSSCIIDGSAIMFKAKKQPRKYC